MTKLRISNNRTGIAFEKN